jgi:hypothetical protein
VLPLKHPAKTRQVAGLFNRITIARLMPFLIGRCPDIVNEKSGQEL